MADRWFTDHPPSPRWPHYTRANAGEVLPTPASPLGQTFMFDLGILPGMQLGSTHTGLYELDEYRDAPPEICGFFGGYFYVNLANVRMQGVRNPAVTVEQLDAAFFGEHPDVPPYTPHPDDENPALLPGIQQHLEFVLTTTEWPELLADRETVDRYRAERPTLASLSDRELLERARATVPMIIDLADRHLVASSSSGIAPGILGVVGEAIGDPTIPMRLLAGLGDVDSAAPSYAMWDLSRQVRSSDALTDAFDEGIDDLLQRVATSSAAASDQFLEDLSRLLRDYGSRGPNEWEVSAETWETDPRIALVAIDRIRLQVDSESPQARAEGLAAERDALIAEIRAMLAERGDEELRALFEGALIGGAMMVFRERGKTNLVKALHECRMVFRELGHRHAHAGNLADPTHIFQLTADELDDFVADPGAFRATLRVRAAEWAKLFELEPPFFIRDGLVPPLSDWAQKGAATVDSVGAGAVLVGVAGSPGIVQGRARVIRDPSDPGDLEPGDIMIAPLTDPAWSPLFMAADGVVVNVGGQISHAIIVSRELGLPCVVSVTDATERIPDGATIEVDGTKGEVRILALA